jgi:ABC-type uncharacterized transport system ATPase component
VESDCCRCDVADVSLEMEDQNESKKRTFLIYEKITHDSKERYYLSKFSILHNFSLNSCRSNKRYIFIANNEEDKKEWIASIRESTGSLAEREKQRTDASSNSAVELDLNNDDWQLLMHNSRKKSYARGDLVVRANSR